MRKAHYLEPLKTDSLPGRHVVFDCETRIQEKFSRKAHYWACGAAASLERDPYGSFGWQGTVSVRTPAELWQRVAGWHQGVRKLVVWAHNLTFDMRVSEALRYLPVEGYTLEAIVLERTASWASFTSPRGTLILCDLYSWLPASLEKLAADIGRGRERMNYSLADDGELHRRCMEDVDLTSEVVRRLLDYLDSQKCGPFRPTGSGQSHAFWRRNHLTPKTVLVHEDAHALERERQAMWAGRAEAWRHGEVNGPIFEHDLNLAYCRIAAECEVPVELKHRTGPMQISHIDIPLQNRAVLMDVEVTTKFPLVPVGEGSRVYWPVGTFTTTLWEPEVNLLGYMDAEVKILRRWIYRTAPVLQPMAQWLIAELDPQNPHTPEPMRRLLKHWARTLVGRCGLRYRQWEDFGEVPRLGLSLSIMHDLETGEQTELLHVGEKIMELSAMAESDGSVPQITGWVMSEARRRLWSLICIAGEDNVIYMDTDSLLVNREGHENLCRAERENAAYSLVHKATWTGATIRGPRDLELESTRRIAGIPAKAVRVGELTFDGEVWAGVKASLSGKQLDNVAVTQREFTLTASDKRRIHLPNGYTRPYEVNEDAPH
jgi:hypothetical protein